MTAELTATVATASAPRHRSAIRALLCFVAILALLFVGAAIQLNSWQIALWLSPALAIAAGLMTALMVCGESTVGVSRGLAL